ncbi:MAG: DinB family protein [Ferruginibacter sp.]
MNDPIIYADYFDRYTALVPEQTITDALNNQDKPLNDFLLAISEEKSAYAYAEGKWTLKEMLQHLIDCERIFAYRALAIARKDPANLPGFEENDYAVNSMANRRSWVSLTEELTAVRASVKSLFGSFSEEMLNSSGRFNNNTGSSGKLGFIIVGHTYHHINVAKDRYGVNA